MPFHSVVFRLVCLSMLCPTAPTTAQVHYGKHSLVMTGTEAKETRKPDDKPDVARKPVKVFLLAGQSNMEGQGFIKADPKRNGGKGSLAFLAKSQETADKFKHLIGKKGEWAVRDDVWIHYLDRKGKLTVGYGAKGDRIGPELGFGHVLGEATEEPVLLIKLAWGGKSLAKDFRTSTEHRGRRDHSIDSVRVTAFRAF